jgi:hypothetical protein
MLGSFCVGAQLAANQAGLTSMQLAGEEEDTPALEGECRFKIDQLSQDLKVNRILIRPLLGT